MKGPFEPEHAFATVVGAAWRVLLIGTIRSLFIPVYRGGNGFVVCVVGGELHRGR